ncbi:MAG: PD-(D/E)XK nuclease family protein [Pseudomonadota bacterium]
MDKKLLSLYFLLSVQAKRNMCLLTNELGKILRDYRINSKWLLAPSLRIGFQWLDTITRAGQPIISVEVKTLRRAALDLAMPELNQLGNTYLGRLRSEALVSSIFVNLKKSGKGYFSALDPSAGLIQALLSTIRDIRLSGISAVDLSPDVFEVREKGLETQKILSQYEEELKRQGLFDYADVLRIAARRLENNPSIMPQDTIVLSPQTLWNSSIRLEKSFLSAFSGHNFKILSEDIPGKIQEDNPTDRDLLRKILTPTDCPVPKSDGTASIYRAIGEVNEVREIFRRCAQRVIPFDEVEILHTDAGTYVPLIYELAWLLKPDDSESIPVTFAEGIPISYSRPGRALSAWLSWIGNNHPQRTLVRMIQDGMLKIQKADEYGLSFSLLAVTLKSLPIGAGASRYIKAINDEIQALSKPLPAHESDEDIGVKISSRSIKRIECLYEVRGLVQGLLEKSLTCESSQRQILDTASWFLENCCRCANQLDEYSKGRLLAEIGALASCFGEDQNYSGFNVWEWLSGLPRTLSVAGSGPRPGCMYVAPINGGGYSGRSNTFILGLDDSKFPGAGLQDPMMLDRERKKISPSLRTSSARADQKMEDFAKLFARLRGAVTLSYCCRSLEDDREMFPSSVLMSAFRILSGKHDGDQDDFLKWLPNPTSFAAQSCEQCANVSEWWLWRTCGDKQIIDPDDLVSKSFPHLGQGMVALSNRQSDLFTEYDGWVPQAGIDLGPSSPYGPILSASRLEKLGSCPLEYFFQYVLEALPPKEYEVDLSVWLDSVQRGTLLHLVFRRFMETLTREGLLPDVDRDANLMSNILDIQIDAYRNLVPPPNEELFNATVRELRMATRIFLQEETVFCRSSVPLYFEAAIGLPQDGDPTPLDTREPVSINLPNGKTIRTRARIDRIDRAPSAKGDVFTVWDYKTGSAWGFDRNQPFRQGRRIQGPLYLAISEKRLREIHSLSSTVATFGYFFPGVREHGERISWSFSQLSAGKDIIARLVEMLDSGCFPLTTDSDDLAFSNYVIVFDDIEQAVRSAKLKMENLNNKNLEPFRKLRS